MSEPDLVYIRPEVDHEDIGVLYRDECNRTGKCPGCAVEAHSWVDPQGGAHVSFFHDDGCPVLRSTAVPIFARNRYEGVKVGRNDPCPCQSGQRFKSCHGSQGAEDA